MCLGARRREVLALDQDLGVRELVGAARAVGVEAGGDEIGDAARLDAGRGQVRDAVIVSSPRILRCSDPL